MKHLVSAHLVWMVQGVDHLTSSDKIFLLLIRGHSSLVTLGADLLFRLAFGAFHGSHDLLECGFGSFLEKSIYALVEIIRSHEVVNYAQSLDVDSVFLATVVNNLSQFTWLLDYLN